jgi:hypothetical protein
VTPDDPAAPVAPQSPPRLAREPAAGPGLARPDLVPPVDLAPPVVGDLHRDGEMVTGWCWSPAHPRARLRVALLVDGVVVAAAVAARLRLDLVREGVRDGYHGFSLPLPSPMPAATRIEARELASGAVFGRILLDDAADVLAWHARADALSHHLSGLHGRLGLHPGADGSPAGCGPVAALGVLGAALAPRRRHCAAPVLRLVRVTDPAVSLVLDVAGNRHAVAAAQACAMLLRHHAAELVVSDDGGGAHAAAPEGATLCVDGGGPAARASRAAGLARGRTLVFLYPRGAEAPCPSALADLLRHAARTCGVLAGQAALSAARRAGLDPPFAVSPGTSSPVGLALLVPRALFAELGGLDLSLEDGASLPFLDFALRAWAAGHEVLGWAEPEAPATPPSPGAAAARGRFSRRLMGRDALPASKAGLCPDPPKAPSSKHGPLDTDLLK